MHMLEMIANPEQRERYLVPLARGRGPLLLRDDRAGARRGLGPVDAAHPRRARRAGAGRSPGASGSSPAPTAPRSRSAWRSHRRGRDDVPGRRRQPRLAGRADDRRDRPRRSPAATPRSSSRTAASARTACSASVGEGFRYAQVRLAPGAPDPLHALARRRPAGAGHRDRARGRARGVRPAARRPRHGAGEDRPVGDRHRDQPAADLEVRLGARPGPARRPRVVDRQGPRRRGGRPGRRPRGADLRRARRLRRPPAGRID